MTYCKILEKSLSRVLSSTSKSFTCLELPPHFIDKPLEKWLCKGCAAKMLSRLIKEEKNEHNQN